VPFLVNIGKPAAPQATRAVGSIWPVTSYLAAQGRSVQFVHSRSSKDVREQAAKTAGAAYRYVLALQLIAHMGTQNEGI
jgi:hypothetical protein